MTVRIRPEAEEELYEAAKWYERRAVGLGQRFLQAYEDALRLLEDSPSNLPEHAAASRRGRDIRRVDLKRFPFTIVVERFESFELILAVAHASRRPQAGLLARSQLISTIELRFHRTWL